MGKKSMEIKLLMLGLDNAGKSTIINDMKGEPKEDTIPTVGFSSAEFKMLNFKVTAYDVGGGPRIRAIWKDYYAEIFGVVYVVDASDHDRIVESRGVLREALSDSRLAGKPFVVFANKQDIIGALSEQELEAQFELEQLAKKCNSSYKIYQCTAFLNGGRKVDMQLKKGLNWLLQTMKDDFVTLHERVQREFEVQKEADKKARAERLERVKKYREERERAEREKEAAKHNEEVDSDDDDVVFGKVFPRVKDLSKTKKKTKAENQIQEDDQEFSTVASEKQRNLVCDNIVWNIGNECNSNIRNISPVAETSEGTKNESEPRVKKKRKKKKVKRNKTAPSDQGEQNGNIGDVLKQIAWKTPPSSLNGRPGRKLEPLRAPLHNNLYSPEGVGLAADEDDSSKFSNGHLRPIRCRPNEEENDVMT